MSVNERIDDIHRLLLKVSVQVAKVEADVAVIKGSRSRWETALIAGAVSAALGGLGLLAR